MLCVGRPAVGEHVRKRLVQRILVSGIMQGDCLPRLYSPSRVKKKPLGGNSGMENVKFPPETPACSLL